MNFHDMSIEEIGQLRRSCDDYLSMWFGFSEEARSKRTPEWVEAAAKRLEGKTEPCCECGEDYPAADLQLGGEIYCANCRAAPVGRT